MRFKIVWIPERKFHYALNSEGNLSVPGHPCHTHAEAIIFTPVKESKTARPPLTSLLYKLFYTKFPPLCWLVKPSC